MSRRSSHSRGSQVLERTPEASHTTGSSLNISMSRQDEKLHLRLLSPKHKPPRGAVSGIYDRNEGKRTGPTVVAQRKAIQQAPAPLPAPITRKDEKQTPISTPPPKENFTMSPDKGHSSQAEAQPSQSYFASTPTSVKPILVLGSPNALSPLSTWQLGTSSQELVTSPNTVIGPTPNQDVPKTESRLAWQEIQKLRENVWDLRSQIHQMRASLREKQDVKAAADDILFRRITYMTARGLSLTDLGSSPFKGQKSLAQLMEDCQVARDEYGPLEDDCTRLEDRVSQQEFRLARLEDQFYTRPREEQQPAKISDPSLQDTEHSVSPSIASDDDDFEATEYHPLVNDYLSKLGDLDLMKERLDEFRDEKAALEAEKQSRHRFGLTLDPEDQEWLDDAEEEYADIIGKMHSLEKELEGLKQTCLAKELIDDTGEPTPFQKQEESCFGEEEDMDTRDHSSEYVKYPLLLPHHPGKKHEEIERYEPKPDLASETATTRINEWILHKLRISPLDVNLLASTFEQLHGKISKEWQFRVLDVWYEDDTFRKAATPEYVPPVSNCSSMSTRHPDETSHSSEMSQEHRQGSVHVLLAPANRPPSVISDDTERAFSENRLNISLGLAEREPTRLRPPPEFTSRAGWA